MKPTLLKIPSKKSFYINKEVIVIKTNRTQGELRSEALPLGTTLKLQAPKKLWLRLNLAYTKNKSAEKSVSKLLLLSTCKLT